MHMHMIEKYNKKKSRIILNGVYIYIRIYKNAYKKIKKIYNNNIFVWRLKKMISLVFNLQNNLLLLFV
jgi:hypothetical protein